jgi:hypothetical protein
VLGVQGGFAVALGVVVLDVVVNEGGFVEGFDGDGGFFEVSECGASGSSRRA